jgi:predicted NBD/HSP70 family sugar kinase
MGWMPASTARRAGSAGEILRLIRERRATTRAELSRLTGLGRSVVSQRLEALVDAGYVLPQGETASTGGRPPAAFGFNAGAGAVLAADLGATHARLGVTDLAGTLLAETTGDMDITDGPEAVLSWVDGQFAELLERANLDADRVRGIGLDIPGPVEFGAGRTISPPIMIGWDGYDIPAHFKPTFDVPVVVDKDVNAMALGEYQAAWQEEEHMLFIKVGTGIGCGIIVGGRVYRGAQGAAGDIGHTQVPGERQPVCRCGNSGCLEAVAGGWALVRDLAERGFEVRNSRDVVRLARSGEPEAVKLVREAGRILGESLAAAVNLFNPSVIVIGGDVAHAGEPLLAGIRELVYSRSLPLATHHLRITRSRLDDRAGIQGCVLLVLDHLLAAEAVDADLAAAGLA